MVLVPIAELPLEGSASALVVDEGRAYVACGSGGLRVVDVGDRSQPLEIGAYDPLSTDVYLHDLVLYGDHVIAVGSPEDALDFRILDVGAGPDPVLVADGGPSSTIVTGLDTSEDRLYLSRRRGDEATHGSVSIYDIREIDEPRVIGGVDQGSSGTYWSAVTVDPEGEGELIYCENTPFHLWSIDVTYPFDRELLSQWWGARVTEMVADGDILHQATGHWGIAGYRAIRIDHLGGFELEAELDLDGGQMDRLHVEDDFVYGVGDDRLWILDASDPAAPEILLGPEIVAGISDIFADSEGYIYVTISDLGLRIYTLADSG